MITETDRIAAERRLAELLGWQDISVHGNGHLVGTKGSTGLRFIPAWTRNWEACGMLIAEYDISVRPKQSDGIVSVSYDGDSYSVTRYSAHASAAAAVRFAVVKCAISRLEALLPVE